MSLTGVMDGCAWCEQPKDTWSEPAAIQEGFKITRSLKRLQRLWERLDKNKKKGTLIRRTGDYKVRKGLCHKPVTTRELCHFTVCHKVSILYIFQTAISHNVVQWSHFLDHKVKMLTHMMTDHPDWAQWKEVLPELKIAKKTVQQALKPGGGGTGSSRIGMWVIPSP